MALLRRHFSGLILAVGVASLAAAATVFALTAVGALGGGSGYSSLGTVTAFGNIAELAPTVAPGTPVSTAPLERILVPAIGVDAPITVKGLGADGVMESPDGPDDVVWYDFTARPGAGSNAVFSGHVDYAGVGPAVFWPLKNLNAGDRVEVRLADGTVYAYSVSAKNVFDAASAPIERIIGATGTDTVTLITCTGTWDPVAKQYDKRLVVQAQRIT